MVRGGGQFLIEPDLQPSTSKQPAREVRPERREIWVASGRHIFSADLSRDEYEVLRPLDEPGIVRRRRNDNWWNGLFFSDSQTWFRFMFANMPTLLVGPGWTGTPEGWEDRWDWTIRSKSEQRVRLLATPRMSPESDWVSEVVWFIERPTW